MILRYIDKLVKLLILKLGKSFSWILTYIMFKLNGVEVANDFTALGTPILNVNLKGRLMIGSDFIFHSGKRYNIIGRQQECIFVVGKNAFLKIGNNVGISCTAIICHKKILIEDNVRIGGGVVIYDTDFHSVYPHERVSDNEDPMKINKAEVQLKDSCFIGAHSIILKGVVIGENSVVGAGSVVTRSIPPNEIWGGNPAKFIKHLDYASK